MPTLSDTADQVLGLGERFRAILDMADTLKTLGSIEQATSEATAALATAQAARDEMLSLVATAKTDLGNLVSTKDAALTAAQKDAQDLVDGAKTIAEGLVLDAKSQAASLIDEARTAVARIEDNHAGVMASANDALVATRQTLDEIQQKVNAKQAEHDALQANIVTMQTAAKTALGVSP